MAEPSHHAPCAPCVWADMPEFCDHSTIEVGLAYALARWVVDDPEATDEYLAERACAFLDDEAGGDVRRILEHVEHDEHTAWTVEARPEYDSEGGQGFAVNGVGFTFEYQQEGPGLVHPAATWRPECDYCGEPVANLGDDLCSRCYGEEEADA